MFAFYSPVLNSCGAARRELSPAPGSYQMVPNLVPSVPIPDVELRANFARWLTSGRAAWNCPRNGIESFE